MLIKDSDKRITVKEVLQHPWVTKELKATGELRRNSLPAQAFAVFTQTSPGKLLGK